jgi:quercetin dioxygenase-like cupin family protein
MGQPCTGASCGNVVNIPADIKHWHGAAKDNWFVHLAVMPSPDKGSAEWMEAVSNEDYNKLK